MREGRELAMPAPSVALARAVTQSLALWGAATSSRLLRLAAKSRLAGTEGELIPVVEGTESELNEVEGTEDSVSRLADLCEEFRGVLKLLAGSP